MTNAYADLATLKSPAVLNAPDSTQDARLLELLETASRWIDGYCGREFYAWHGERRFDGSGRSWLPAPDLVAVSKLQVREASAGQWTGWPASAWLLYPLNGAPTEPGGRPYTRIMLASGQRRRFPLSRAGVAVTGVWGYGDVREDTGVLVSGSVVTAGAATVSVSAAGDLAPGHTIRIGAEQLYVTGVSATTGGGATLTVQRGVNGTTAAAHALQAAVSVYRYPPGVTEACLQQASAWWRERVGAPFGLPTRSSAGGSKGEGGDAAIAPVVRELLGPYRRRLAALGV